MFGEILAVEEPDITVVSIRPGVVDTDIQNVVRDKGKDIPDIFFFFLHHDIAFSFII